VAKSALSRCLAEEHGRKPRGRAGHARKAPVVHGPGKVAQLVADHHFLLEAKRGQVHGHVLQDGPHESRVLGVFRPELGAWHVVAHVDAREKKAHVQAVERFFQDLPVRGQEGQLAAGGEGPVIGLA
jgi:hypothetical protein